VRFKEKVVEEWSGSEVDPKDEDCVYVTHRVLSVVNQDERYDATQALVTRLNCKDPRL
jgi:hypothetical protein